jgi:hypothetical protein
VTPPCGKEMGYLRLVATYVQFFATGCMRKFGNNKQHPLKSEILVVRRWLGFIKDIFEKFIISVF